MGQVDGVAREGNRSETEKDYLNIQSQKNSDICRGRAQRSQRIHPPISNSLSGSLCLRPSVVKFIPRDMPRKVNSIVIFYGA